MTFCCRCLLSKKAVAVMAVIQAIFSYILRFCSTLTSSVHPSPQHHYHTMCHTHHKFCETAGLLMKGITIHSSGSYVPSLPPSLAPSLSPSLPLSLPHSLQ